MSIQLRLILAIGTLLLCVLAAMIAAVLLDAHPRIEAETASTMRFTKAIVQSSIVTLEEAADPRRALDRLVASMGELRHVRVVLASRLTGTLDVGDSARPEWTSMFDPDGIPPEKVPVHLGGTLLDVIVIVPKLSDEMSEVWDAAARILEYGLLFSLALVPLTGALIKRSLKPIHELAHAMRLLEEGNYDVRIAESGPPELSGICARLNTLASALRASRAENVTLSARMVQIQDEERREIARELHDDLGPHLFALRARASFLARALAKDAPGLDHALKETSEITAEIDALQKTNRRVLNRLSPAGLKELGLAGALQGIAAQWRKEKPGIELTLDIPAAHSHLGDSTALTIYRVCQEGLTNAYRHAEATRIALRIDAVTHAHGPAIRILLQDDGIGLSTEKGAGHGIRGMHERVAALGGSFTIQSKSQRGTQLEAIVPHR